MGARVLKGAAGGGADPLPQTLTHLINACGVPGTYGRARGPFLRGAPYAPCGVRSGALGCGVRGSIRSAITAYPKTPGGGLGRMDGLEARPREGSGDPLENVQGLGVALAAAIAPPLKLGYDPAGGQHVGFERLPKQTSYIPAGQRKKSQEVGHRDFQVDGKCNRDRVASSLSPCPNYGGMQRKLTEEIIATKAWANAIENRRGMLHFGGLQKGNNSWD